VELLAFVGIGALLTRRVRAGGGTLTAAAITVGAFVWVFLVTGSGFNQASNIVTQYSYLIGPGSAGGALAIVRGVLTHPGTALRMLARRWHDMARPLITAGTIGVVSPSGALVAVGVLVPAALAASPAYISAGSAFQTLAVVPFVLVGTVAFLTRWAARAWRTDGRRRDRRVVAGATAVLITVAMVQDARLMANIPTAWWRVTPAAAAALDTVLTHTSPRAEIIASNGVIGRFSERRYVYLLGFAPETIPVKTKDVVFVITPRLGNEAVTAAAGAGDAAYVSTALHARTLVDRDGVVAVEWRPPPGTRTVTLGGSVDTSRTSGRR
jgi:hypothetical protein